MAALDGSGVSLDGATTAAVLRAAALLRSRHARGIAEGVTSADKTRGPLQYRVSPSPCPAPAGERGQFRARGSSGDALALAVEELEDVALFEVVEAFEGDAALV